LKLFFEETGIGKVWFAKKIGTVPQTIYQVLLGSHQIPVKCWTKAVEITQGRISLADLLNEKLKENSDIEIIESDDPKRCEVRIKGSQ